MKPIITAQRLREVVSYSPVVGVFEWRKGGRRIRRGGLAGAVTKSGYIRICVDGRLYEAHRLAWLYMTGDWPAQCIDHVDGDRSNNAFKNLRLAEYADNSANMKVNRRSTTGVKGVTYLASSERWRARVIRHGQIVLDKLFASLDEAKSAAEQARELAHGDFHNHGVHCYEREELAN